jgi:DNA-directed RNA polymerase subunit beta'
MKNIIDFKGLKIQLASSDIIKAWSHGEVTKPETINYRTLKPEKNGLFCERIFGPVKDWECYCGKYKRIRYRGIICDKCGVEVTQSRVRRERMGHIGLASPVAHVWFFKGTPSKLSLLLNISPKNLANVIYFAQYVVLEVNSDKKNQVYERLTASLETKKEELREKAKTDIQATKDAGVEALKQIKDKIKSKDQQLMAIEEQKVKTKQAIIALKDNLNSEIENAEAVYKTIAEMVKKLKRKALLTEDEYLKLAEYDAVDFLRVGMGAEAVLELVSNMDLDKLIAKLREETRTKTGQKRIKATKRLRVVDGFKKAGIDPSWMVLKNLPVIPPDLRPMVQLSGGRFATSDLNDLYRRVINRNNRLKHLIELGAPEIILRNEKRMLQEAVDSLIDASQSRASRRAIARKPLRSLSDMLRGKQGRFRQNLLGKRVDYSGRSVIVVGPELALNQCGIPKDMALELFKPYVLRELIKHGIAPNVKSAKHAIERRSPEVFDILEDIIKDHPVLLNRAPTLHKLGIQAFFPILVEGSAIRIHPCVCSGYNADFDGDQMAVHVPLSIQSIEEAKALMMPNNNLLKPADGAPISIPNKDMALGCYYLTSIDPSVDAYPTPFSSSEEAIYAQSLGNIGIRQQIRVKLLLSGEDEAKLIDTTVGRILFNEILPATMGFINKAVNAAAIKDIVKRVLKTTSNDETTKLIDSIKSMGFYWATFSGLSVAVSDCVMITDKDKMIAKANDRAAAIEENYRQGLITLDEKRRLSNETWIETTDEIAEKTWNNFANNNAVKVIIESGGTRASKDQVKQLAAMRGLVVDPLGKIVELPTKSNFREGLSIFEYVTSSRGSRKGLTDSALKTADAGYLTRRLVDVAHDSIVRLEDCGTTDHITLINFKDRQKSYSNRILGRITVNDIIDPKSKKTLVAAGELIDEEMAEIITSAGINEVNVYSPLTCKARYGLCAKCYGWDFSTKRMVEIGTPVGVIAAQSIGEPGTQLTMRVKHAGGIVGLDVTQGLPRVEELFEARIPKFAAPMSEIAGKVSIKETDSIYMITVKTTSKPVEEKTYTVPLNSILKVAEGDLIDIGTPLSSGPQDVKQILEIKGLRACEEYLINSIQEVYESQGISINDKHFEVIVRKMSDKVKIDTTGDTSFLPGEVVDRTRFEEENDQVLAEGGEPSAAQVIILGITNSSLYTASWLSAASFQHTTSVLTSAAAEGKEDQLLGLKENVIIGRLIPCNPERATIAT